MPKQYVTLDCLPELKSKTLFFNALHSQVEEFGKIGVIWPGSLFPEYQMIPSSDAMKVTNGKTLSAFLPFYKVHEPQQWLIGKETSWLSRCTGNLMVTNSCLIRNETCSIRRISFLSHTGKQFSVLGEVTDPGEEPTTGTFLNRVYFCAADREHYPNPNWLECRDQQIVGHPTLIGTYTRQPLHIRLREHCGRRGREIVRFRKPGILMFHNTF